MVKEVKREVKKITLGLILSWIFGVIFAISGLGILASSIVGGLTTLIMAVVLLPPMNKLFKEKMNFELSKGIKITIIIIGLIIVGVTANNDVISTTTDKQSNPSVETNIPAQTQNTPQVVKETKVAEPQGYYAGDFVDVGNFRYRINSYYTTPQIGQDIMGTFLGAKASGTYLVLSVTIENIAKESKTLLGNNIVVIDSEGRQFSHDMTAEIYLSNNQQFNFQQMQPGLPRTGKIVFDVPKNIRGYLEISSDDMFSGDKKDVSWNPRNQTS